MLSKMQKIWLGIFGAMFLIPEILFSIIFSSIVNYSGKDFLTLSSLFVDSRFFINNSGLFFLNLVVELVGIMGLLIINIKNKKILFSIILLVIFLWLIFISFLGYISSSISLII
jgi:hypothetical protein